MMLSRFYLIRMFRVAPLEMLMALISGAFSLYGIHAYDDYLHAGGISASFTPLLFAYGRWPFYGVLFVTVSCLVLAHFKTSCPVWWASK